MEKSSYMAPSWAADAAPEGYSLEILKEGKIIEKILLNSKTHYILGRMGGSVDILMEHVSISRQHCCLQFRDDDVLMVLDLGSAQGSFLNKTKLAKDIYHRVNVGDILRFGASTRLYIVNGPAEKMPSEYDSVNMKLYREKLIQNTAKIEAKKLEVANTGASWGFGEDAENPPSDEEEETEELPDYVKNDSNYDRKHGKKYSSGLFEESLSDSNHHGKPINEKDAAIMEKIRVKERKIQNMQEEIRRIYLKESSQPDGLTEGQGAAVSRNDKRIEELKESIQELLDNLKLKSLQRDGKSITVIGGRVDKKDKNTLDNDDNDEIFDTTTQTADINTNWRLKKKLVKLGDGMKDIKSIQNTSKIGGTNNMSDGVLTYEDLMRLKDDQNNVINDIKYRISELESIVTNCSQYFTSLKNNENFPVLGDNSKMIANNEIDDVDNFVLQISSKEAILTLKSIRIEETSAMIKLKNIEKLLKIATPALQSLAPKIKNDNIGNKSEDNNKKNNLQTSRFNENEYDKNILKGIVHNDIEEKVLSIDEKTVRTVRTVSGPCISPDSDNRINATINEGSVIVDENNAKITDKLNNDNDLEKDRSSKELKISKITELVLDKKESKKRARIEESAQMQSLSSFMKFAEEEKRKNEKEEQLKELRELHGDDYIEISEKIINENEKKNKKIRSTNEFTTSSSSFEIGKLEIEFTSDNSNKSISKDSGRKATAVIGSCKNEKDINENENGGTDKMKNILNSSQTKMKSQTVRTDDAHTLQGGESVWIPPRNQTGDGRTSLNAKLGY